MSEPKLHFDPDRPEGKPAKKGKSTTKSSKERRSTRQIPMHRHRLQNGLTIFFYVLFTLFFIVIVMNVGRMNTVIDLANKKEVKANDIAAEIQQSQQIGKIVSFEGNKWLQTFFTHSKNQAEQDKRVKQLNAHLSGSLEISGFDISGKDTVRSVKQVQEIKQETVSHLKEITVYKTTYDVQFVEQNHDRNVQVVLYGIYQDDKMKLIQIPEYLNANKDTGESHKAPYTSEDLEVKGEVISGAEKTKMTQFVEKFLALYCRNDSNLNLVASVQGIDGGTFQTATLTNSVRKNGKVVVQGTYTFYFQESSAYTSAFTLEMRENKGSYFVDKMND
ncbi:conjugal transfer protein [Listeria sp. ILCC797]|uniref:conjugal transfer protein n=1 Tax=Listeria sp. ILCC797 TaxID=1918333 RepID=UPI000B59731D|nr:conjugal transfer protein [Listeria sp. ILCC797]